MNTEGYLFGRWWLEAVLVKMQEKKEKPLQILSVQEKFNPGNLLHGDEANGSRVPQRRGDIALPSLFLALIKPSSSLGK